MEISNLEDDYVFCPLVDHDISFVDCMENRDIKPEFIPKEYKEKYHWKEICMACPFYKY